LGNWNHGFAERIKRRVVGFDSAAGVGADSHVRQLPPLDAPRGVAIPRARPIPHAPDRRRPLSRRRRIRPRRTHHALRSAQAQQSILLLRRTRPRPPLRGVPGRLPGRRPAPHAPLPPRLPPPLLRRLAPPLQVQLPPLPLPAPIRRARGAHRTPPRPTTRLLVFPSLMRRRFGFSISHFCPSLAITFLQTWTPFLYSFSFFTFPPFFFNIGLFGFFRVLLLLLLLA